MKCVFIKEDRKRETEELSSYCVPETSFDGGFKTAVVISSSDRNEVTSLMMPSTSISKEAREEARL